jgi:prolyl oligopeptidase
MRYAALLMILPLAACATNNAEPAATAQTAPRASIVYPATERQAIVENQFGVPVADRYRWLENDVREDKKVAAWVAQQNALTDSYLATLPDRPHFMQRLRELYNFERFGVPEKAGNRYFYTRNTGLQNQSVLYVREGVNGTPRMLIDPNTWSEDGATALAEWQPSEDGRRVLYSVQEGGTDWRIVRVLDADTGRVLKSNGRSSAISIGRKTDPASIIRASQSQRPGSNSSR